MDSDPRRQDREGFFSPERQKEIARWVGLDPHGDPDGATAALEGRLLMALTGEISIVGEDAKPGTGEAMALYTERRRTIKSLLRAITGDSELSSAAEENL